MSESGDAQDRLNASEASASSALTHQTPKDQVGESRLQQDARRDEPIPQRTIVSRRRHVASNIFDVLSDVRRNVHASSECEEREDESTPLRF